MQPCLNIKALLDNGNRLLDKAKQLSPNLKLDKKSQLMVNKLNQKYNL